MNAPACPQCGSTNVRTDHHGNVVECLNAVVVDAVTTGRVDGKSAVVHHGRRCGFRNELLIGLLEDADRIVKGE